MTTATARAEPWSRRCSTETILSLQGKETDVAHDTSDSESRDDGEWEPVDVEDEEPAIDTDSSGFTDTEIISTKVIEVSVADDGDLQFADSELTAGDSSSELDSELDLLDFWQCARCSAANNNPLYRYCETCFKVRKNLFPPRPKRKHKWSRSDTAKVPRTLSQDSGVESQSQELSQGQAGPSKPGPEPRLPDRASRPCKRRAHSADRTNKRVRVDSFSESEATTDKSDVDSSKDKKDPVEGSCEKVSSKEAPKDDSDNLCIVCCAEPKSGVFVHGRIAHICCCYKCALKVWAKAKRCPICNCKVSNVLKAVVM